MVVTLNLLRCLVWRSEPPTGLLFRAEGGLQAQGCLSGPSVWPLPPHIHGSAPQPPPPPTFTPLLPGSGPLNLLLSARISPHGDRVLPAVSTLMHRGLGSLFFR